MLIVCPSCATSYAVQPSTLPPQGCQVRCLRCRTVWYAQLDQADKLLAAAAAIAADFVARSPNPCEEGATQAGHSWDVVVPDSRAEPSLVAGSAAAEGEATDPEPDCSVVAEEATANSEPQCSTVAEIVAVNPEPDCSLVVAEDATANPEPEACTVAEIVGVHSQPDHSLVTAEGAVPNLLPESPFVAEVIGRDSQPDHAAALDDERLNPDVSEAAAPLVPATSASETPTSDQSFGIAADAEHPADHSFVEVTRDESSTSHHVDVVAEEPSADGGCSAAMGEDAGSVVLQFGAEDCSDGMKAAAEHAAALSKQADPGAGKHSIDLRADYSNNELSEKGENIKRRTAPRSRRKAAVQPHGWNVSTGRLIPRWPLSNLHSGILALALVDILLVGWRTDIVRKLPQTASFYALAGLPVNLRGLAFDGITTSTVRDEGVPILVVEGNIVNDTRKNLRVPQLKFVVRDAAAQEIYSWTATAARASLLPGQALAFRTRLASLPPAAHDVVLRFVNRRDAVAVIR